MSYFFLNEKMSYFFLVYLAFSVSYCFKYSVNLSSVCVLLLQVPGFTALA